MQIHYFDQTNAQDRVTRVKSLSFEKPNPYTWLARESTHWQNFCEVLVKLMRAVTIVLINTFEPSTERIR